MPGGRTAAWCVVSWGTWALIALDILMGPCSAATVQPSLQRWMDDRLGGASSQDAATPPAEAVVWIVEDIPDAHLAYTGEDLRFEGRLGAVVQLRGSAAALERLSLDPGIRHLGTPPLAFAGPPGQRDAGRSASAMAGDLVETQALAGMNVQRLFELGITGAGVKVGVIDVGFAGFDERLGNELPRVLHFRGFGDTSAGTSAHGTACAEVVHDVAPDASIYLARVSTAVDLQNAVDWLLDEGVEVISHSLAWFLGGGAGDGPITGIVADAASAGITWVTSSGNFARSHWAASFVDTDEDGYLEFEGREQFALDADASAPRLILLWNRWPTSEDVAFRLEVLDDTEVVASSELDFEPSDFAYREASSPRPLADPTFRIRLLEGNPAGLTLRVFRVDGGTLGDSDRVAAGSLAIPADSPYAISVGAYPWSGTAVETFSSYGPSVAGVAKPELLGPDRISTSLRNFDPFVGTSAACPHVAGAVALHLSAQLSGGFFDAHLGTDDVRRLLADAAQSAEGPAGSTGWGRLRVNADPWRLVSPTLTVSGYGSGDGLRLYTAAPLGASAAPRLLVVDAAGRRVLTITGRLEAGLAEFELRPGLSLARGRYWAWWPQTRARAGFFWERP